MIVFRWLFRVVFTLLVFGGGLMTGRYVWPQVTHVASQESCKPVACTSATTQTPKPEAPKPAVKAKPAEAADEEEMYCEPKLRGQKEPYCYPKAWREDSEKKTEPKADPKPGKQATDKSASKMAKTAETPIPEPEVALDPVEAVVKFQKQNEAIISKFRAKFKKEVGIDILEPGENPPTEFVCDDEAVADMTKFADIFKKSPLNTGQAYFQESVDKFEKIIFWLKQCIAEP